MVSFSLMETGLKCISFILITHLLKVYHTDCLYQELRSDRHTELLGGGAGGRGIKKSPDISGTAFLWNISTSDFCLCHCLDDALDCCNFIPGSKGEAVSLLCTDTPGH